MGNIQQENTNKGAYWYLFNGVEITGQFMTEFLLFQNSYLRKEQSKTEIFSY